jgi:hypothetical protein
MPRFRSVNRSRVGFTFEFALNELLLSCVEFAAHTFPDHCKLLCKAEGVPTGSEVAMKALVCRQCGSCDIRRSKRHGVLEWILKRFFIVPWRCVICQARFFHFR